MDGWLDYDRDDITIIDTTWCDHHFHSIYHLHHDQYTTLHDYSFIHLLRYIHHYKFEAGTTDMPINNNNNNNITLGEIKFIFISPSITKKQN